MNEKRFTPTDRFRQFGVWCFDEEQDKYLDATSMVSMLNELNDECEFLAKQRDYWKQEYDKRTKTFTFPPNCDECDFLGNNGICGYCKFTLNCYDSKEDLIDGEVLPNCPLKPLINMNGQLREINKELGDDLYNCRINKNIIREKLKLWQDVHKKYDIYNIKDFEESFELDAKTNKEKDEKIKELEVKVLNSELEKTNKAMYNRLKEQSEIIYQLIQKLKEHITERELKELMEDCGL